MAKNKKSYKNDIIALIIIIILLIILFIIELNTKNDNIYNPDTNNQYTPKYYDNIRMNKDLLNIIYFNVGQADSTLITSNGINMLIDAGNNSDGYYIANFLKEQNINKLHYLILTHMDEDHAGGAYKLIEDLNIDVIYMPNIDVNKDFYENLVYTAKINNVTIDRTLEASDTTEYNLRKCYLESFKY